MSKNIEKQGKHIGYIIGGILAIILGALFVLLYFPTALYAIAGVDLLWDFSATFDDLLGANFMTYINDWALVGVLILMAGVYFVCCFARPSACSTMFRLSAMFSCLALAMPLLADKIKALTSDTVDLTLYAGYALFGLFILSFILYVIGFVLRFKQKYHKNRATTTLVFASTFWWILALFPMLEVLNGIMNAEVAFFVEASTIVQTAMSGIIGVFFVISAIWLFCTVPHRVVVDYNPDTRHTRGKNGRPKVLDTTTTTTTNYGVGVQMEPFQSSQSQTYAQPQQDARFAHNYGNQTNNGFNQNPVLNGGFTPAQPQNFNQGFTQPQQNYNTPQQNSFNQQPSFTPTQNFTQPQPQFKQPQPMQRPVQQANPYESYNNFAQNSPYNRQTAGQAPTQQPRPQMQQPQASRPSYQPANQTFTRPQVNTNTNLVQPARPTMPNQLPPRPMPNAPRPATQTTQPAQQMPRQNPFAQGGNVPPQAPRPVQAGRPGQPVPPRAPTTPFNPPRNPNNPNGTNNGAV